MISNYDMNKRAIDQYRKELKAMFDDISEIDTRILTKAVNEGVKDVKRNTPVDTGMLRKSWRSTPIVKSAKGVEKSISNYMDYASYVNYGHRVVTRNGITRGFVKGVFMLENAMHIVDLELAREFKKEIERVNRKYDK